MNTAIAMRIAMPNKGSLADDSVSLVREAGYKCRRSGKELFVTDKENDVEFVFLRPRDIATYVARGVVDIGVTGRDLNEDSASPAMEVMGLGFGGSEFRYAVPDDSDLTPDKLGGLRIACSYPNIVKRDLERRNLDATIIKVDGAVEISVRLGVADAVADVVESGRTLREAGLKVIGDPVMKSEAIIIARDESVLGKPSAATFITRVRGVVLAREYAMIEYNICRDALGQAVALTPGVEAPTVAPLNDPGWVAVKAMAKRSGVNKVMDRLSGIGAKGIVVTDIRACRM